MDGKEENCSYTKVSFTWRFTWLRGYVGALSDVTFDRHWNWTTLEPPDPPNFASYLYLLLCFAVMWKRKQWIFLFYRTDTAAATPAGAAAGDRPPTAGLGVTVQDELASVLALLQLLQHLAVAEGWKPGTHNLQRHWKVNWRALLSCKHWQSFAQQAWHVSYPPTSSECERWLIDLMDPPLERLDSAPFITPWTQSGHRLSTPADPRPVCSVVR